MKKITALILVTVMTVTLGACGTSGGGASSSAAASTAASSASAESSASSVEIYKYGALGRLTKLNVAEDTLNDALKGLTKIDYTKIVYYDNLNSMVMGLTNGDIAMIGIDDNSARYIISRQDKMITRIPYGEQFTLAYSMLMRKEDSAKCDRISAAIKDIKADGTIDKLKKTYIDDVINGTEPTAVKPEQFDGAETLKVAVTGDRPPMDYISSTGEPVGFNTALVAEVAKRMKVNVEFVHVDSGARGVSLKSGVADVIFWSEVGDINYLEGSSYGDQPEDTVLSEPYLTSPHVYVVLRE
ncbi:MAG: transporter substrate-binding domain-containing protein [Lachnospiraceae bacterium]|nr:transporter substrate-binding domain-containing protein [Lachnospiraceae bacterium]